MSLLLEMLTPMASKKLRDFNNKCKIIASDHRESVQSMGISLPNLRSLAKNLADTLESWEELDELVSEDIDTIYDVKCLYILIGMALGLRRDKENEWFAFLQNATGLLDGWATTDLLYTEINKALNGPKKKVPATLQPALDRLFRDPMQLPLYTMRLYINLFMTRHRLGEDAGQLARELVPFSEVERPHDLRMSIAWALTTISTDGGLEEVLREWYNNDRVLDYYKKKYKQKMSESLKVPREVLQRL